MKTLILETFFEPGWEHEKQTIPEYYQKTYRKMFPSSPRWPSPRGIAFGHAFRERGCNVVFCRKPDVLDVAKKEHPDLVFTTMNLRPLVMRELKKITKVWFWYRDYFDEGWEKKGRKFKGALQMVQQANWSSVTTEKASTSLSKRTGKTIRLMPHPVDARHFSPDNVPTISTPRDIVFMGRQTKHRDAFLREIDKRFTLTVWGEGYPQFKVFYAEIPWRYTSHIHLNLGRGEMGYEAIPSSRIPRALSCRQFVLSEQGDLAPFIDDHHIATFTTKKDMIEKIEYYLTNPAEGERMANNGHHFVRSAITTDVTVGRILEVIQG